MGPQLLHILQYLATSNEPQRIVDTNNFHQVLEYFNEEGHLKNPSDKYHVIFTIPCAICQERNLALLNHYKSQRSRTSHETYAVLPCGHSFGYPCIHTWLLQDETCPSCRRNPFGRDGFAMLDLFGDAAASDQHREIKDIKALLERPPPRETRTRRDARPGPRQQQMQVQSPFDVGMIPRVRRGGLTLPISDRDGVVGNLYRRGPSDRPFDDVTDFLNP